MTARTLLLTSAASLFLLSSSARAQESMDHAAAMARSTQALADAGIAEGTLKGNVHTVEMKVTEDGFVPAKIKANKGEKLRLVITRKTERTCAKEIVIAEHGIKEALPLEKTVVVEVTPKRSGELKYACGMGHITGVVFVP